MSVAAQNTSVNDIWSMPDSPPQAGQVPSTPTDPQTTHDNNNNQDLVKDIPDVFSASSFGKSGLARGGESPATWETDTASLDMLEKAKKQEAEVIAEIEKAPETVKSVEIGEELKPAQARVPKEEPQNTVRDGKRQVLERPNVKDLRTGKERTHRVDPVKADDITKTADLKEQEFIEGVEQIHSLV